MFGTEFLNGQGLGNQLFCYVTARCLALDFGYEFGCAGKEQFAMNIHNDKGMYFLDVDLGENADINKCKRYNEEEYRIFLPNSRHDITYGCYVAGVDSQMFLLQDDTIIYGNLQDEKYFLQHKQDIKRWLQVKAEYESYKYTDDNLCILNFRGGEYVNNPELFLSKEYWDNAMQYMKKINPQMKFMIITEDVQSAEKMFPDIPAYHFDIAGDYVTIKNARYLIVSNSSFAFFPIFTSETLKFLIAPKYWARHNVSDGYWASEQNIYTGWNYMDRKGNLFSAEECRAELEQYKLYSKNFKKQPQFWKVLKKTIYSGCFDIKYYYSVVIRKLRKAYEK